ncbi:hypothetical protein ABZ397_23150 [Streptomyces sp. NPDC005876]|uniref:DUF6895 family protein n=1 Tax=Streptomyces sp. NPDC005876 TaxID=3157076 RepID=UPI00340826AE
MTAASAPPVPAPRSSCEGPSWPPLPAHAVPEEGDGAARVRAPGSPPDADTAPERVLTGALRWTEANLEWFRPERWEEYLPPRPFRPGPLLELLGLLRVLDRDGVLPRGAALPSRALDLAAETAADPGFARSLRRGDAYFPYHLDLITLLEHLGRPQPGPRARCEALLAADAGGHCHPYKPVLNRLELRYFLDRGGLTAPPALPTTEALYRQSVAALAPDALQLTESETYALTHAVFYATDFGRHPAAPDDDPDTAARLRRTVRDLLGVHLARGSLDLLAELLLCARALAEGPETHPAERAAWQQMARAARPDGALPSPVHRPEVLTSLTGDKAAAYLFGTCYHTTTAAALAAATLRRRPPDTLRPATGTPPPPCADPAAIRIWARRVTARAGTAPASLLAAWRDQLAPLLTLAVQARDPHVLADLIEAAGSLGVTTRSPAREAAALLAAWTG